MRRCGTTDDDRDKDDCLREERNHKKGREEERGEMPLQVSRRP